MAVLTLWGDREPAWPRWWQGRAGVRQETVAWLTGVSAGQPCYGVDPCPKDNGDHGRILHTEKDSNFAMWKDYSGEKLWRGREEAGRPAWKLL